MVDFKTHNLLETAKHLGKFDVVLCRNVLMSFDQPTNEQVLSYISDVLSQDGVLYLGSSETVQGLTDRLTSIPDVPGLYQQAGSVSVVTASR
jgi:chemotaxis protein methyltransferase CheR